MRLRTLWPWGNSTALLLTALSTATVILLTTSIRRIPSSFGISTTGHYAYTNLMSRHYQGHHNSFSTVIDFVLLPLRLRPDIWRWPTEVLHGRILSGRDSGVTMSLRLSDFVCVDEPIGASEPYDINLPLPIPEPECARAWMMPPNVKCCTALACTMTSAPLTNRTPP